MCAVCFPGDDSGAVALYRGSVADFPAGSALSRTEVPLDAFVFAGPGSPPSDDLVETLVPNTEPYQLSSRQDPSVLTNDPSVLTSDPSVLTNDPSVLTSNPSVLTSDPSVLTSDPSVLTINPSVLTSAPSVLTSNPSVLANDPSVLTSDPSVLTSAPSVLTSDPSVLTSDPPQYRYRDFTVQHSYRQRYRYLCL